MPAKRPVVDAVAAERRILLAEMDPYLMSASGFQPALDQGAEEELLDDPDVRHGPLAIGAAAAPAVAAVAHEL